MGGMAIFLEFVDLYCDAISLGCCTQLLNDADGFWVRLLLGALLRWLHLVIQLCHHGFNRIALRGRLGHAKGTQLIHAIQQDLLVELVQVRAGFADTVFNAHYNMFA